jgi:phosphatidylserine decarboxylase
MGYFAFGGSTIVLLFKKDSVNILPQYLNQNQSSKIRMGQPIATHALQPITKINYNELD